ncbi:ribosomal protein S14, S11 [Dionaea muscipula]
MFTCNLSHSQVRTLPMLRNALSSLFSRVGILKAGFQKPAGVAGRFLSREFSAVSEKRNIPDHKRRLLAAKYEVRRKLYKALCSDPNLPSDVREKQRYKLSKLPRNSSFTRVRNRCIFSGRPRAVYKKFRMSRIVFRSLASQGLLMGVKKASW